MKFFLASKTILFNLFLVLFALLEPLQRFLTDLANVPELSEYSAAILAIVGVVNILLRFRAAVPVVLSLSKARWHGTGNAKR